MRTSRPDSLRKKINRRKVLSVQRRMSYAIFDAVVDVGQWGDGASVQRAIHAGLLSRRHGVDAVNIASKAV
jgi:hypothetical protein